MTLDPSATPLPGTSLLAFARLWFPPAVVASVFEPLVADWQGEAQAARSRAAAHWINVRWQFVFLANGIGAAPRLVAIQMPAALMFDITLWAILFGTLGFVLQDAFGRRGEIAGAVMIDSVPFALLPLVMRIRRRSALPEYATRSLALLCAIAASVVLALVADGAWATRLGAAAMPLIVAFMGWRLSDARRLEWTKYHWLIRSWLTMFMLASTWMLASYPIKLALGMPLMTRFWGMDVQYLLSIVLTALLQVDDWRDRRRQAVPTGDQEIRKPEAF